MKVKIIVASFFAIVLLLVFGLSDISKIDEIDIRGNRYVHSSEIESNLGIAVGDSFWAASVDVLERRIRSDSVIRQAKVDKTFPSKVSVTVEEYPAVAIDLANRDVYFSNGGSRKIISGEIPDLPVLSGWPRCATH